MTDSNVVKVLFALLRSGLWDRAVDDFSCFPLNEFEWNSLFKIACEQTVEGIVYDGIQQLPKEFLPPRNILLTWVVRIERIETRNMVMNTCIQEQLQFFERLNVKPILLKGQGIANYYPKRNHRVSGDIDWYFDETKDSKIVEKELKAKNVKIFSLTIDSLNYAWRSCEVEHHTKLFDVFNPLARLQLDKIKRDKFFELSNGTEKGYKILPPFLNIIQVNLHILKHLLSFGIGLRQFCDSAILYASLIGQYDKEELFRVYKKIGILDWIYVLHDLLVRYIGLSEESLPFPLKQKIDSQWMLEDVMTTGNFGFFDDQYSVLKADNTIERKHKTQRIWYALRRYFGLAPYEAMCFPVVHFVERFKSLTFG